MTDGPRIFTPEYYERLRQLEDAGWWNAGMRDVAADLLLLAQPPTSGRMLDVGCGSGQTLAWFERRYRGWRAFGFDVAADGVRAAQEHRSGHVFAASALAIPVTSGSIDIVVTLDMMQHLPLGGGDAAALSEIYRVLKPGGHLFVRTNAQAFPRVNDDAAFNFHKYRPAEFRAKLKSAGFRVLRLSRINALLGLAEIPRELCAKTSQKSNYHGLLATAPTGRSVTAAFKREWLRFEGRVICAGCRLPLGRTLVALCQR